MWLKKAERVKELEALLLVGLLNIGRSCPLSSMIGIKDYIFDTANR